MLIENRADVPDGPASRGKPSRNDAQRWLAELEREFLQANDAAPQHCAHASAGLEPRSHPRAPARQTGVHAAPADRAPGGGSRAAPQCSPAGVPTRYPASAASKEDPAPALAVAAARDPHAAPAESCEASAMGALVADTDVPPPIALPQSIAADRPLGPDAPCDPANTPGRPLAPAPTYARRLMTLTDGEHASATIRDASLAPAGSQSLACSVSLQLQAAGLGVQRIFINGQRFDSTPSGVVLRPGRPQLQLQDDHP